MDVYNSMINYIKSTRLWKKYTDDNYILSKFDYIKYPATMSQIVLKKYRLGVSYASFEISVQLSAVVIALYCLIVITYFAFMGLLGITGTSWDSVGKLFLLALNSEHPSARNLDLLVNTSAGAETFATFNKEVSVISNHGGSLELDFRREARVFLDEYNKVEYNEKY